jgi:aminoglycoside 6-adenylyltransferase
MGGNHPEDRVQALCRRIVEWAKNQPTIQAVLLIGSCARIDHPADLWSDLDLLIFANQLQPYTDPAWLSEIGDVLLRIQDLTGRGDPEWIVVFSDGMKADFAFVQIPEYLLDQKVSIRSLLVMTDEYHEIYERGSICLMDRYNPATENQSISIPKSRPGLPSQEQLSDCIQNFLIEAFRTAKFIKRNEVWRAAKSCNLLVQHHLLTLVEWQARATRGPDIDTWYDGRFLEDWAAAWFIDMLPGLSAGFDLQQLHRSLQNSLRCAERLALEIATALDLEFPHNKFSQAKRLISTILAAED